jgi:hypothetical protein
LARHAIETDWTHASAARELYRVQILANQAFFRNSLPLAVLAFNYTARGSRSSLRIGRNELGVKHEINLNLRNIGASRKLRAVHVIHELLHLREALFDCREPTCSYHSQQFLARAAELGLPMSAKGAHLKIVQQSPVDRLFRFLNIVDGSAKPESESKETDESKGTKRKKRTRPTAKLVAWNCGCTEIFTAPGILVEGQCLKATCGGPWKPAASPVPSPSIATPDPESTPRASSDDADQLATVA